jgi:hypothetical protein
MVISLREYLRRCGLDRPVLFSIAARGWSVAGGPITLVLVGMKLSPEAQGYYYTFGSVLAIQQFLDLGMNQSVVQFISHEWARLSFSNTRTVTGDEGPRSRFILLGRISLRWYSLAGCLGFFVIGGCGHWFFAAMGDQGVNWLVPWWSMCGIASLSLLLSPIMTLIEGCNQLSELTLYRLINTVASSLALWATLYCGGQLYSGVAYTLAGLVCGVVFLATRWSALIRQVIMTHIKATSNIWTAEIWPLQRRIALSWISGYLIFQLFNPITFHLRGAVEAGKLGMTLQAVAALATMASAWTITKIPLFGILISRREFDELDRVFLRSLKHGITAFTVGSVCTLAVVHLLSVYSDFGNRFADLATVLVLCAAMACNVITTAQAFYLRAHRREPFMWLSIANGVGCGLFLPLGCWLWGIFGMSALYALIQMVVVLLATRIWSDARRLWHL